MRIILRKYFILQNDALQYSLDVWTKIHARLAEHGFIFRYPKRKEAVTGYAYEPWHVRCMGVDIAKEITDREITLEAYLGVA